MSTNILDCLFQRKKKNLRENVFSRPFLLHCPIAFKLWSLLFSLFGISWVTPKTMVEILACWQGKFGHHHNGVIWMVVPHCLMWCITIQLDVYRRKPLYFFNLWFNGCLSLMYLIVTIPSCIHCVYLGDSFLWFE